MATVIKDLRYDSPHFTIKRETHLNAVQSPAASATGFAHFRCRNKCIVTHVMVTMTSLPSAATSISLKVMRDGASAVFTKTLTGFTTITQLSGVVMTIASSGTLTSIGNHMSLQLSTTEKGKFDVVYEYQFLAA